MLTKIPWGATPEQKIAIKKTAKLFVDTKGVDRIPAPPRSVTAQPSDRGVLLTWLGDPQNHETTKTKIYVGSESQLVHTCPPGVFTWKVPAPTGAAPPVINIFLTFANGCGGESRRISVQCQALAETAVSGPPTPPNPPAGWNDEPTGGGNIRWNPKMNLPA